MKFATIFFAAIATLSSLAPVVQTQATQAQEVKLADAQELDRLYTNKECKGCNLAGADLVGWDLTNAQLQGANLNGANLTGANLTGANLTKVSALGANLVSVKLQRATLIDTNFMYANLAKAEFGNATIKGTDFQAANLTEAVLVGATITKSTFVGANLFKVRMSKAITLPANGNIFQGSLKLNKPLNTSIVSGEKTITENGGVLEGGGSARTIRRRYKVPAYIGSIQRSSIAATYHPQLPKTPLKSW
jgi:uncharacterized protein YjbI with pentapeptide repeats